MMETNIKCRMLQICDELKAEGYRVTGSLGDTVYALKHPNGNRMTIIYAGGKIGYIKNGTLKKSETVERLLPTRYVINPKRDRTKVNKCHDTKVR